jgi:cysteinyl-tRNA synthetase
MVTVDGQKMGKSLNNFITLKQAFSGTHEKLTRSYDPLAIRQLVLNSHYRSPLDFSDAALFAAQSGYEKVTATVLAVRKRRDSAPQGQPDEKILEQLEQLKKKFEEAMNDDLNTAVALSVIFDITRLANTLLEGKGATKETFKAIDESFGKLGGDCLGIVKEIYLQSRHIEDEVNELVDMIVKILIEQRNEARKKKDFARADAIRNKLTEIGVMLEDTPDGTVWRMK